MAFLQAIGQSLYDVFLDPQSIFYGPYLFTALVITLGSLVLANRMSPGRAWRVLFAREIWLTKSTLTDVIVSLVYIVVFNVPTVAFQAAVSAKTYAAARASIFADGALGISLVLPAWVEATIASLLVVLCFDFSTFLAHWAMHRVPVLWDIHAVHHSPETLNVFSAYRQHPLDRFIRNTLGAVFTAAGMAAFHAVFPSGSITWTVLGLGVGFFIFMLTVNLQHSHVPVHYPRWLRPWLLSPHLHQLHHSSALQHRDRNFGGIFPYWDRMFGTYLDETIEVGQLRFGLAGEDPFRHSVWRCYLYPFYAMAKRPFRRRVPVAVPRQADAVERTEQRQSSLTG